MRCKFFYSLALIVFFLMTAPACVHGQRQASAPSPTSDSLSYKIGQILMIGFRGMSVSDTNKLLRDLKTYHIGATIFFDYDVTEKRFVRNIDSPRQVKSLCRDIKKLCGNDVIIAIDQEGGRVNRLKEKYGFMPSVSAQTLGKWASVDSTARYAAQTAKQLSELGINLNFAPVCDVNVNTENPVIGKIERSFSRQPDSVALHARAVVAAHHDAGILTALKHFPGHGSSKSDSHLGFTDVSASWTRAELVPFAKLAGETDMIMTAHIFNSTWDTVPATLSRNVITTLLRDSLKFNGVVVSDDMQMKAIAANYTPETALKLALNAGVDLIVFGNNVDYDERIAEKTVAIIRRLIETNQVPMSRLNDAFMRVQKLKATLRK
jgi:beta-N-acetylhexosaminidase